MFHYFQLHVLGIFFNQALQNLIIYVISIKINMTGEQALYGRNKWLICLYMYYYLTKCRKSNEWLEHVPKSPELLN